MAQLRRDNEAVLKTLEEGDLVEFDRGLINHWGVYVGMYQCPLSSCIILLAFPFHISFEYSFQSIIMKYKVCNCSSLEGIRFKDKDSKIEKIF